MSTPTRSSFKCIVSGIPLSTTDSFSLGNTNTMIHIGLLANWIYHFGTTKLPNDLVCPELTEEQLETLNSVRRHLHPNRGVPKYEYKDTNTNLYLFFLENEFRTCIQSLLMVRREQRILLKHMYSYIKCLILWTLQIDALFTLSSVAFCMRTLKAHFDEILGFDDTHLQSFTNLFEETVRAAFVRCKNIDEIQLIVINECSYGSNGPFMEDDPMLNVFLQRNIRQNISMLDMMVTQFMDLQTQMDTVIED